MCGRPTASSPPGTSSPAPAATTAAAARAPRRRPRRTRAMRPSSAAGAAAAAVAVVVVGRSLLLPSLGTASSASAPSSAAAAATSFEPVLAAGIEGGVRRSLLEPGDPEWDGELDGEEYGDEHRYQDDAVVYPGQAATPEAQQGSSGSVPETPMPWIGASGASGGASDGASLGGGDGGGSDGGTYDPAVGVAGDPLAARIASREEEPPALPPPPPASASAAGSGSPPAAAVGASAGVSSPLDAAPLDGRPLVEPLVEEVPIAVPEPAGDATGGGPLAARIGAQGGGGAAAGAIGAEAASEEGTGQGAATGRGTPTSPPAGATATEGGGGPESAASGAAAQTQGDASAAAYRQPMAPQSAEDYAAGVATPEEEEESTPRGGGGENAEGSTETQTQQRPPPAVASSTEHRSAVPPSAYASAAHENSRSAWVTHGAVGTLVFGLLVPSAISSALFRDSIPAYWIYVHVGANCAAFAATFFAVGMAFATMNSVGDAGEGHMKELHHVVGLLLLMMVSFQTANGFLRPPREFVTEDERDASPGAVLRSALSQKGLTARNLWHLVHALTGLTAFALGTYQVRSGLELFARRFGSPDWGAVYVGYAGWLTAVIAGAKVWLWWKQRKVAKRDLEVQMGRGGSGRFGKHGVYDPEDDLTVARFETV
ncbi:hypothetical protein ACHAWF_002765 [Thalassiosira exigua]